MGEVWSRRLEGYWAMSRAGNHVVVGDEATESGGHGFGPSPFMLLLAALGHCTLVTLTGVSRDERIPLAHAEVELRLKLNMAGGRPEDPRARNLRIHVIRRYVRVWGPIEEQQKERLYWATKNCPVSRALAAGVRLIDEIELVGAEASSHTDTQWDSWRGEVGTMRKNQ